MTGFILVDGHLLNIDHIIRVSERHNPSSGYNSRIYLAGGDGDIDSMLSVKAILDLLEVAILKEQERFGRRIKP